MLSDVYVVEEKRFNLSRAQGKLDRVMLSHFSYGKQIIFYVHNLLKIRIHNDVKHDACRPQLRHFERKFLRKLLDKIRGSVGPINRFFQVTTLFL